MLNNISNDNLLFYINPGEEDERNPYKNRMKEVNLLLTMNNFPEIGDLFDSSLYSVNKTLNLLQILLDDRQKLLDSKSELMQKMGKTESEYLSLIDKTDSNKEKINELNNKLNFIKNKMGADEKKFKEDIEKIKNEKIELEKSVNRLVMKENQYKHEIKKNEKEIEDLKARLKKINEKEGNKDKDSSLGVLTKSTSSNAKNYSNNNLNEILNPSIKLSNTLNSVMNDNTSKNSSQILHNIEHFKEFYNLIYKAFNEKLTYVLNENCELRDCYRLILREINQFIDNKKLILYKFSQDSLEDLKDSLKNYNSLLNFNIFELDFNDSRDLVLTNFNEILNAFRFILIYDILKLEPTNEFEFEEMKKLVVNKKYEFESLPYYKQIRNTMETFNFEKLNSLKSLILKSNVISSNLSSTTSRKKNVIKDEVFMGDGSTDRHNVNVSALLQEGKALESLEEINKDLIDSMNLFEEKFNNLEKEFEKVSASIGENTIDEAEKMKNGQTLKGSISRDKKK